MAINDPITGELITDADIIKNVSLEHNLKILTKNKPRDCDLGEYMEKQSNHSHIMIKSNTDIWELDRETFDIVVKKIILKDKNMYKELIRSGPAFKDAIFLFMKKMIATETIPNSFCYTTLIQIWKGKGSALDLNNMRFIHMRSWHCKLLEALITEKMKPNIVKSTPNIQIGGMPGHSSVEHLVVLKTWMKQLAQKRQTGIFQTFDLSKFFDKESLLDCMFTLNRIAKIDDKCYRIWYKINERTRISVKTSVGESGHHNVDDCIGQGQVGAALVSSLNIGSPISEAFKDEPSAIIGKDVEIEVKPGVVDVVPGVPLSSTIFQDDVGKFNETLKQAREAALKIDEILKRKQLSANYDKSKFIVFGNKEQRKALKDEIKGDPIKMGNSSLSNSIQEKYLGDLIHENGCGMSITVTYEDRIRRLISKCTEIIKLAESPLMGVTGNSLPAFRLYESTIIPTLIHNCESWIGLTQKHLDDLQSFQNKFIRDVLRLPVSTPKAILQYDVGLMPMKWRIAKRKLLFVNKILSKDHNNLCKQVLFAESLNNIKGLSYECTKLCEELGLPNIMVNDVSKSEIVAAINTKINADTIRDMENCKKVADRLSPNPADSNYLASLPLSSSRVWLRYRARAIKGVKYNTKTSNLDNLTCRFCRTGDTETQEHLELCDGNENERRKLSQNFHQNWAQLLTFWSRMSIKLAKHDKDKDENVNDSSNNTVPSCNSRDPLIH